MALMSGSAETALMTATLARVFERRRRTTRAFARTAPQGEVFCSSFRLSPGGLLAVADRFQTAVAGMTGTPAATPLVKALAGLLTMDRPAWPRSGRSGLLALRAG